MSISIELWQEIKQAEQNLLGQADQNMLNLKLRLQNRSCGKDLLTEIQALGGTARSRGSFLLVQAPVGQALNICYLPGVQSADLPQAKPAARALLFFSVAMVLAVGLGWGVWTINSETPMPKTQTAEGPAPSAESKKKSLLKNARLKPAQSSVIVRPTPGDKAEARSTPFNLLYQAGRDALEKGEPARAMAFWGRLADLQPRRAAIRLSLAKLLIKHGQADAARDHLKAILEYNPRHQSAADMLARLTQK